MSKKNSLKKQLAAAIAMVLVAALALSTSTFAWFVNNKTATAKGMTVNATADSSLLIKGLNAGDDHATAEDNYTSVGTNTLSITTMKPATSFDGVNFAKISDSVKVESEVSSVAKWTGTEGALGTGDLVKVTAAGEYYMESKYDMMSKVEDATIYVSSIDISKVSDKQRDIDKSLRVSVTVGSTTKVYNPLSGTLTDGKAGKYASDAWTLDTPTYASCSNSDTFSLTKDTATDVIIRVWFEGQDTSCYTKNVSANDVTVTVNFEKVTA